VVGQRGTGCSIDEVDMTHLLSIVTASPSPWSTVAPLHLVELYDNVSAVVSPHLRHRIGDIRRTVHLFITSSSIRLDIFLLFS
jgi:hypothetical protein